MISPSEKKKEDFQLLSLQYLTTSCLVEVPYDAADWGNKSSLQFSMLEKYLNFYLSSSQDKSQLTQSPSTTEDHGFSDHLPST